MSSHARHRASGNDEATGRDDAGAAADADATSDDAEQTAKDRSYSPGSERETEVRQRESSDATALRPGTGGPDDSGDLPAPEELDVSIVAERSPGGQRPNDT
ncbi:hypothetical protein [Leifsonia sp. Leaf336]|uniref:hypothetical protein n=1 Tax=Leifsonia sp. Leaf336 TaxID=1736341 RepID=UPI000A61A77F|nr:hypothetical protein [Leifsonia sp. Leaf336]